MGNIPIIINFNGFAPITHLHFRTLYLPKKEADGKSYVKYQVIGNNSVAVPTHFYKVIVGEKSDGNLELESYIMPNHKIDDKTPLAVFRVNKPCWSTTIDDTYSDNNAI